MSSETKPNDRRRFLKFAGAAGVAGIITIIGGSIFLKRPDGTTQYLGKADPTFDSNGIQWPNLSSDPAFRGQSGFYRSDLKQLRISDDRSSVFVSVLRVPSIVVSPNGPDEYGDYGPNTPGTTTAGIQEAVNAANGGRIFIRLGTYTLNAGIVLTSSKNSAWIEGESGTGSVQNGAGQTSGGNGGGLISAGNLGNYQTYPILKLANSVNTHLFSTSSTSFNDAVMLTLKNLWIDGNKLNNTSGHGIDLDFMQLTAENLIISNFKQHGIYGGDGNHHAGGDNLSLIHLIANGASGIYILYAQGCHFSGINSQGHGGYNVSQGGYGLYLVQCAYGYFEFETALNGMGAWLQAAELSYFKITAQLNNGPGIYIASCNDLLIDITTYNNGQNSAQSPGGITGNAAQNAIGLNASSYLKINGELSEQLATQDGVTFDYGASTNNDLDLVIHAGRYGLTFDTRNLNTVTFSNTRVRGTVSAGTAFLYNPNSRSIVGLYLDKWLGYNPVAKSSIAAGTSPYTFPLLPYDAVYVLTTLGGMTALTLDGQSVFSAALTVAGETFYVAANHTLIATWATTAPVFEILPI